MELAPVRVRPAWAQKKERQCHLPQKGRDIAQARCRRLRRHALASHAFEEEPLFDVFGHGQFIQQQRLLQTHVSMAPRAGDADSRVHPINQVLVARTTMMSSTASNSTATRNPSRITAAAHCSRQMCPCVVVAG